MVWHHVFMLRNVMAFFQLGSTEGANHFLFISFLPIYSLGGITSKLKYNQNPPKIVIRTPTILATTSVSAAAKIRMPKINTTSDIQNDTDFFHFCRPVSASFFMLIFTLLELFSNDWWIFTVSDYKHDIGMLMQDDDVDAVRYSYRERLFLLLVFPVVLFSFCLLPPSEISMTKNKQIATNSQQQANIESTLCYGNYFE